MAPQMKLQLQARTPDLGIKSAAGKRKTASNSDDLRHRNEAIVPYTCRERLMLPEDVEIPPAVEPATKPRNMECRESGKTAPRRRRGKRK